MTITSHTGIKPLVLAEIEKIAQKNQVQRVILFGSRSRGDYKERSDIDLAFSGGNSTQFILEVDENTSTLLNFDIINLDAPVQKELLDSINKEGIIIYEKI